MGIWECCSVRTTLAGTVKFTHRLPAPRDELILCSIVQQPHGEMPSNELIQLSNFFRSLIHGLTLIYHLVNVMR